MIDTFDGEHWFLSQRYPVLVQDRDGNWCKSVAATHPLTWDEWLRVTRQKFNHPELGAKLLATGDQQIAGALGAVLTEVRDELRVKRETGD